VLWNYLLVRHWELGVDQLHAEWKPASWKMRSGRFEIRISLQLDPLVFDGFIAQARQLEHALERSASWQSMFAGRTASIFDTDDRP